MRVRPFPCSISIYITLSLFFRAASSLLSSPSSHSCRSVNFLSCFAACLFPTKDHGEDALARPAGLVARFVLDPVTADVEATARVLRATPKKYHHGQVAAAKRYRGGNPLCEIRLRERENLLPGRFRAGIPARVAKIPLFRDLPAKIYRISRWKIMLN